MTFPLFNNIQEEIISRINNSKSSLKIVVTWFTNHEIFDVILSKLKDSNYNVELVVLNDQINNKAEGVDFQRLIDEGASFYFSDVENMIHHKFCVIDGNFLITGSYNWTYFAENRNWENVICTEDNDTVGKYLIEFEKIRNAHQRIENIAETQKHNIVKNTQDYLISDYQLQAKKLIRNGNELRAIQVFSELLKIDKTNSEISENRNQIVKNLNKKELNISPFEIGVKFENGYIKVIPEFVRLPVSKTIKGHTTVDKQKIAKVPIQIKDNETRTLFVFDFENFMESSKGTLKLNFELRLERNGLLYVTCTEIGGFEKVKPVSVSILSWIR